MKFASSEYLLVGAVKRRPHDQISLNQAGRYYSYSQHYSQESFSYAVDNYAENKRSIKEIWTSELDVN